VLVSRIEDIKYIQLMYALKLTFISRQQPHQRSQLPTQRLSDTRKSHNNKSNKNTSGGEGRRGGGGGGVEGPLSPLSFRSAAAVIGSSCPDGNSTHPGDRGQNGYVDNVGDENVPDSQQVSPNPKRPGDVELSSTACHESRPIQPSAAPVPVPPLLKLQSLIGYSGM
jgi:hypothetical protein